ncbi:GP46-like surface antigen, putative, partial [Bodo saltans]
MVSVIWSNTPVADRNTTACLLFVCMIAASEFMAQHVDAACTCTYRLPLLQELYDATNGAQWVSPWDMTAVDAPCNFDGVTCGVSNDITSIVLSSRGLDGTLPPSLGQLGGLVTLKVDSNFLDGSLPPEFQNWTSLQTIDVSDNNVSGTLPSEYCLWTQLTFFHASRNKLEGSMPASYSAWEKCDQFDVSHNQLTGTLPPVYGSWSVINVFTAGVNGFGGVLPSSYANWSRIGSFNVSMNSLTGTLPPGYASFVALGEFDVSYNNLFGTVPVQYAAWKSMSRFYLASNKLSGTISNSLFGAWLSANAFSVRRNALTGTIPSTLLALTTLQVAYLGLNMFTGVIPTTISSSLLILDLQNNTGLMGTLPSRSMFVTVCGTGVCPTTSLPPQYCLSVSAAESLSSTGTSDPVQMLTELGPYSSSCTPPDALHLTSAAPQAANADNVLRNVTVTYLDPTTRSIGLAVSFVSSVVGGSGGALRGAVPGLQRATTALRLTVLCSAGANASANDAMFSDRSDNALGLSVPVGSSGLEYAAGAPIGNAMLVFAVGACLHGVAVVRERLQLLTTLAQSALRVLPTSLLPGAFAVAYGTQMQPSFGASFALVVVSTRTAQSVACGIALLVVWLAFPLYCVHRALVACRTEDGAFGLASIQAAKRRRERNGGRRHSNLRFARVQSLHEFWMTPCAEWVVPPKTTLSQSASAAFVLKHLEP